MDTRSETKVPDPQRLLRIGETAAAGYYEGLRQGLPYPREWGLAYRTMYEHMPVRIDGDHLLYPYEPFYEAVASYGDNAMHGGVHDAASMILNRHHSRGFEVLGSFAERKKAQYPGEAAFIDELLADLRSRHLNRGSWVHSIPDVHTVLTRGFRGIRDDLERSIAGADDAEMPLMLALRDCADGVEGYWNNTREALRRATAEAEGSRAEELCFAAREFENGFMEPAVTFAGGLLAVNFLWMLDACDSIGRLDYELGELLERDLASGRITIERVRRMLDDFWHYFENMNGWNLTIGGSTPDGGTCYNRLTEECLLCDIRTHIRRPNLSLRVTHDMPARIWELTAQDIFSGTGKPALYHDDLYTAALRRLMPRVTPEDAALVAYGGCTETMLPGLSCVDSKLGNINFAKVLEDFLYLEDEAGQPRFASYGSFEAFLDAFEAYIAQRTREAAAVFDEKIRSNMHDIDPKLMRTLFTSDCVRNRRSFEAGGARYNFSIVSYDGTTTAADSLMAIRHVIYEERVVTPAQLLEALRADFRGWETLQARLNAAPKFGNGLDEDDRLCTRPLAFAWRELLRYECPRGSGGKYLPSIILFSTYQNTGRQVGATPDGRHAGEPLNDSIGAYRGNDTHGPTALLRSVLQLPLSEAAGTPVLNLRLNGSLLRGQEGAAVLRALTESFFEGGGMQIQYTVQSSEEMRAAQREPEKHRNLIVRIGGYSEYFNYLSRELQDTVIRRTEQA